MNREEIISAMNAKGAQHSPFVFIIDFLAEHCHLFSCEEAFRQGILFDFDGVKNYSSNPEPAVVRIEKKEVVAFPVYETAFNYVQDQISMGNSYLVNLTFPSKIEMQGSLADVFHVSKASYRLLFGDRFVVFSPETFVRIEGQTISTYPMKGTMDAAIPNAKEILLRDGKEMAEHATVVDLLRNDLSRVAANVRVERFRYVDEICAGEKRLLQVSSKICGDLPADYHSQLGSILFEMLPAGSVTGAPKKKTLEIISAAEKYERGYYTGIAGYYDGENLDSCVLIRFIENDNGQTIYKSGGGITSQSKAEEEYQELKNKIYVPIG